jgi:hypothetical protein
MVAVVVETNDVPEIIEQVKHRVEARLPTLPVAVELDVENSLTVEPDDEIDERLFVGDLDGRGQRFGRGA